MKKAGVPSIMIAVVLLAIAVIAEAQQPKKVPRIGILPPVPISERVHLWEAFRQGLRELGYVEGQNITLVFPSAEVKPEGLHDLAAELVSLKVDVIVAPTTRAAQAAMDATRTIPIVIPVVTDPVGIGLVTSLARPGGNVTGLTTIASDLSGKRLELLKEVVPGVSRIAVLSNPTNAAVPPQMRETEVTARALGVQLQRLEVRGPDDFDRVFQAATKERAGALITLEDAFVFTQRTRIVKLAAKNGLPAMYGFREFVDAGGLMSYAANLADMYRRAATYVDKILKGRKPADLPVEQPTKFEFIVNLKAAKQIGLTIPPNVLVRADRVIK
jgi:putative tryptophan/tyrosine transport system substrate-binding protein